MIIGRKTKLRFRRNVRKRQKQALELSVTTEDSLDRYVFRRLFNLVKVRRFILGWVGLIVVLCVGVVLQTQALSSHYLEDQPVAGGTYREGIVGTFTNANPLYAQTEVDASASRLLFSGLFTYNLKGELVPNLAEKYELDSTQTLYTVYLKDGLKWDDGQPLTAQDVVFTFSTIQKPEAKSYLISSWRGVTVEAVNDKVVTFKLANSLSAFPQSLTTGIIPKHVLGSVAPSQLRSSSFNNQHPVGSGPFAFQAVEADEMSDSTTRIAFGANQYYVGGKPQLERFIIRAYQDEDALKNAFKNSEVDSMVGLEVQPEDIDEKKVRIESIPLTGQVMIFFKNSQEILKDPAVRKALVLGVDKKETLGTLPYPVLSIDEPLLSFQIGYNRSLAQVTNMKEEANKILDTAGWVRDPETNIRMKGGQPLKFRLFSSASSEFTAISGNLQKQWRELGVEAEVVLQSDEDLQSSVSTHNYDALMYGIAIGADPDVYAYWHGSQTDVRSETRLNLSEYKSAAADKALEAGRTRSDKQNRAVKYKPFLEAWRNDAPALALYQPRFLYITTDNLNGFQYGIAHTSSDRYATVNNWTIRSAPKQIQE